MLIFMCWTVDPADWCDYYPGCGALDALWALYFDIDWSSGDYRLCDPDGRAVWTSFCA